MEKHASKPATAGGIRMSDGDWVCSDFDCGNVNFSRRTSCNRCGKERAELKLKKKMGTEIGKSAADKSRGLFSADDWQCNKCANVNWARRQTCNVCNAPKFGEVEARTGYGGGYNERGTVEYRPRRDSDEDEYDEFGRRKKKKNKEQPEKVMSIQRVRSLSAGSQQGDQHATYKKPNTFLVEESKITKCAEHNSENRSADYLRESRYSRSSENSSEMLKKPTLNSAPASAARQGKTRRECDLSGEQYTSRINEWPSKRSNLSSPRDCIMENRVSSTNEIKYRFTGRTIDENFEVTYTLEERICAAAWAIAYSNCRMSAEQFQNTFDKPAPDFKTVFAWRQRLLSTGCLVDNHNVVAENTGLNSSKESIRIQRKLGRRKRARYYEQRGETTESSSEDRPKKVLKRKVASSRSSRSDKVMLEMSSHDDTQAPQGDKLKSESDNSEDDSNSGSKDTQSKRDSSNKPNTEYDPYMTDPARSVTPELTNLRMDLANVVKSPQRKILDGQFAEDIYFDEDIRKAKAQDNISNEESQFLMPDIPKGKKTSSTAKSVEDSLKSVLEDIISESERYSSDDASENDFSKRQVQKSPYKSEKENRRPSNRELWYQPSCTVTKPQVLDLPLPKFAEQNSVNAALQGCGKNMSSALRRIYETMTSQSKGSDGDSGLEYVPTKINPAMAKRNHQLFSTDTVVESVHDIFSDNSTPLGDVHHNSSVIPAIEACNERQEKPANIFKIQMFEDYVPDDDALYKDGSSEGTSDKNESVPQVTYSTVTSIANIPMPDKEIKTVDPVPVKDVNKTTLTEVPKDVIEMCRPVVCENKVIKSSNVQPENVNKPVISEQTKDINEIPKLDINPLATLLNLNLSNINAEALTKALKDIQTLAATAQQSKSIEKKENMEVVCNEECVEVCNDDPCKETTIIVDDSDEPKTAQANIPFLSDMFDPGTPSDKETDKTSFEKPLEKQTDLSNLRETNLDDLLDLPPVRPIGGFKSFAIPKPIMLNRLKSLNPSNDQNTDISQKGGGKRKKKKAKGEESAGTQEVEKDEEEDEESGEDGDLSKYDLWGSDEETSKDKPEAPITDAPSGTETPAEKAPSSSPQNNDDRRSRSSKKSSGSTSRSSSSSSSSSDSSSGPTPRNRFDDFNLNSELSRAESADSSRSRSNSRERKHHSGSRSDKKRRRSTSRHRRDRHSRPQRSDRDKLRKESDRRHHNSHRHRR